MMKSIVKKVAMMALVCIVALKAYNKQSEVQVSDVVLANVEALAELESDMPGVGTTGSCTEVCYKHDGWMCTRIYNGETSRCVHYRKK